MVSVNGDPDDAGWHVMAVLGEVFEHVRTILRAEDWGGLRPSHFRVIDAVRVAGPDLGISVTDLAERVGMTKQGCGQFVAQLVESGHLVTAPDPTDRRVRLVRRTPAGEAAVDALVVRLARLEDEWRAAVGAERYATFRAVAEELSRVPGAG